MESYVFNKVNILPTSLLISKDDLWQIINNATSVLIVDINDQTILFANPNSIKELRIIENNEELVISEIVGKKFKFPIIYGEKFRIDIQTKQGLDVSIEMDNFVITWNDSPAYFLIIKSCIKN